MSGSNAYRRDRCRSGLEQGNHSKDSKEADGVACDEIVMNGLRKRLKGHKGALQIVASFSKPYARNQTFLAHKPHLASQGLTPSG